MFFRPAVLAPLLLLVSACLVSTRIQAQPLPPDPRFDATRQLLEQHVEARKIAGGVAVVSERGRVMFRHQVGWQDVASQRPMSQDTLFRIASMTKPITSVAVMMLVEQNRFKLTDPLEKFVPEFADVKVLTPGDGQSAQPPARSITIHDLLTHQAGLTYGFFQQQPHGALFAQSGVCDGLSNSPLTLAENTRKVAQLPLTQQPGSGWQYGLSTDVLGRVVEVASGQPFDEFVGQRILQPLRMNHTYFVVPSDKLPQLATLYRPGEDQKIEAVGEGPQTAGGVTYTATFQYPGKSNYRSGGAGLVSTADDYLRFLHMLLNGGELDGARVLARETVQQMTTNQIADHTIAFTVHGDKFGYGFGVHSVDSQNLNGASPGTFSWGGIFHTYFWADPKRQVAGVLMTQLFPFNHLTLWGDFQKHVYDALDATVDVGRATGPQPGEVYREFAVHNAGNLDWRVTDPRAKATGAWEFLPNPELQLEIGDLHGATRAEAVLDRWGGHLRTTDKRIRFNNQVWLRVPELDTPPSGRAEYYYSQDNPVINVPLEHLRPGINTLDGHCTTRDGYNWGQWGLYSLMLRVYYADTSSDHAPTITSPATGATFNDNPTILVQAADARRVDVLAWYEGDDENGDGRFADWHGAYHQLGRGEPATLSGHVGSDDSRPFELRWDTTWVPDQKARSIQLIARAQNADGLWRVGQPVDGLSLDRRGEHVTLIRSTDVPERFGVRVGQHASCTLSLPESLSLDSILEAKLSLRTWHGWDGHHQPLKWNDHALPIDGNNHHYDFDRLSVPVSSLRHGKNVFQIQSDTHHHMLEVLWPGPVLLVRHRSK